MRGWAVWLLRGGGPVGVDVIFYAGDAAGTVAGDKGSLVGRSGVIKCDKSAR